MRDDCVFCGIASGKLSAHTVFENEQLIAFLDLNPIRPGHTQIIPKVHIPYFDHAPMEVLMPIVMLGQKLATAIKTHLSVPRVAFLFTGGDIPHLHAHVVPMHEKTDITSRQYIVEDIVTFRDAPRMQRDALEAVAADLRRALADTA